MIGIYIYIYTKRIQIKETEIEIKAWVVNQVKIKICVKLIFLNLPVGPEHLLKSSETKSCYR